MNIIQRSFTFLVKVLFGYKHLNNLVKSKEQRFKVFIIGMVAFTIVIHCQGLKAQCIQPVLDAGLYCKPDAPESAAPIICNLDCLEGFTASMPSVILPDQPESLCGSNGTPNNLSWFAFVAGDAIIDITITPSNCQPGSVFSGNPADVLIGIQTGIYGSCSFEEEDIITCFWDCADRGEAPVTLSSDQFEVGEVYYLFVDGCGGSVCDYTVTINTAVQAFEIPEITTISNENNYDFDVDPICQGSEIILRLDDLDFDINYEWRIEPPITEYPTGVHPVTDTNTVEFIFSDEGVFDIIVFAYNDCDSNVPDTFQVVVKPLGDEVFTDVSLCEECIADGFTLVSPNAGCIIGEGVPLILTEDPNEDGILGWQGLTEITESGLQTNVVKNILGCEYTQSVNIVEIPLAPREDIDLYFCFNEFPKNIDGVVFNSPGTKKEIIIENGAASGCDSLLQITALAIDFFGSGEMSKCIDGMVSIDFDMSFVEPTSYDSIVYTWINDFGDEVLDFDGVDHVLELMVAGTYFVEVTVYKDGSSCTQSFGTFTVDEESLSPTEPMVAFAPNNICISEGHALIYLDNQGLGEQYEWIIIPDLPITFGLTSDTVYVDVSSGLDFEFCVSASNDCGVSTQFCDIVNVSEVPSSDFDMPIEICIDSSFIVASNDLNGISSISEFYWSFEGANVLNLTDALGPGPFELQFDDAGDYTISMYVLSGGCESILTEKVIMVTAPFEAPTVSCNSLLNGVSFSFDDSMIDGFEVIVNSGQAFEIIGMDSIFIGNLSPEEEVDISLLFNDDHVCGGKIVSSNCVALPCPEIDFDVLLSNQNQCVDEDMSSIDITMEIIGLDNGVGEWDSPFIINDAFDVAEAGVGEHEIIFNYEVAGCSFLFDTTIFIYKSPDLEFDLTRNYCDEDVIASLQIDTEDNTLTINGAEVLDLDNIEFSEAGIYQLQLEDADGCSSYEQLIIEPRIIDPSEIIGSKEVVAGNIVEFETNDLGALPDVSYTWYLDDVLLCENCMSISFEAEEEDLELCMVATYDDGCEQEACIDLTVVVIAELYIPNIFSPNGDGLNDNFKFGSNAEDLMIESITIFSRWGELMFESAGTLNNEEVIMWDGYYNGMPSNAGVYLYVIRYLDLTGKMVQKTGDVTLVR